LTSRIDYCTVREVTLGGFWEWTKKLYVVDIIICNKSNLDK